MGHPTLGRIMSETSLPAPRRSPEYLPKIVTVLREGYRLPDFRADACSSAQDNLVVKIHTDSGHTGIGETDTNPWVARAMIEAPGTHIMGLGLTEMLIGQVPDAPVPAG